MGKFRGQPQANLPQIRGIAEYKSMSIEETLKQLAATLDGLNDSEVKHRLE